MVESTNDCEQIIRSKSYYEVLSVSKDCSSADVRKAYKKLAIKYHPDKNKDPKAADAFKKISHAFSVLSDEQKRANYDRFGHEDGLGSTGNTNSTNMHFQGFDPFDLFNQMFNDEFSSFMGRNHSFGGNRGGYQSFTFSDGTRVFTSTSFGGNSNRQYFDRNEEINEEEEEDDNTIHHRGNRGHRSFSHINGIDDLLINELFGGGRRRRQNTEERQQARNRAQENQRHAHKIMKNIQICIQILPILCIFIFFIFPYLLSNLNLFSSKRR